MYPSVVKTGVKPIRPPEVESLSKSMKGLIDKLIISNGKMNAEDRNKLLDPAVYKYVIHLLNERNENFKLWSFEKREESLYLLEKLLDLRQRALDVFNKEMIASKELEELLGTDKSRNPAERQYLEQLKVQINDERFLFNLLNKKIDAFEKESLKKVDKFLKSLDQTHPNPDSLSKMADYYSNKGDEENSDKYKALAQAETARRAKGS
ncbi:MAG: hypothetical protein H0W88_12115 [Parachlamydiaceae bacterium]|nr:hypothetical protein [Parachlamydiaceae bacterium]